MAILIFSLYGLSLFLLLIYSLISLHLAIQFQKKKLVESIKIIPENYPKITVQLPLYNEKTVIIRLLDAVQALEYDDRLLEIQILDDSKDETSQLIKDYIRHKWKRNCSIFHIQRSQREGFKAGALKYGLESATGDYVAIFDADFQPQSDFLKTSISYFSEDSIALVQSRWTYSNSRYSILTRAQSLILDNHFIVEQTARNRSNYFINFNGTAGVWRKSAIIDAGNWQSDTLTEDLDLSIRAQLKGWKFIYLNNYSCPSELPIELKAVKSQQYRWTKGAVETAKKLFLKVWQSNISFKLKLHTTFHLTSNFVFPAILLLSLLNLPIIYLKNQGTDYTIYFILFSVFSISVLGPFIMFFFGQKYAYKNWFKQLGYYPLFMIASMGLALNNTRAVWHALIGKKTSFVRTPKYNCNEKTASKKISPYNFKKNQYSLELIFFIYSLFPSFFALVYNDFTALPFYLMFTLAFCMIVIVSFYENLSLSKSYLGQEIDIG